MLNIRPRARPGTKRTVLKRQKICKIVGAYEHSHEDTILISMVVRVKLSQHQCTILWLNVISSFETTAKISWIIFEKKLKRKQ